MINLFVSFKYMSSSLKWHDGNGVYEVTRVPKCMEDIRETQKKIAETISHAIEPIGEKDVIITNYIGM